MSFIDKEAALKADYADLGVSCGYIGNLERWGDDRRFMVFTNLADEPGERCASVGVTVEPKRDANGRVTEIEFDTPKVRERLDAIRERLRKGELHRVA